MRKITEIAFCCYAVTDMKRPRAACEGVLGLKPTKVSDTPNGQRVEYGFGPHALTLGAAPGWKPSPDGCAIRIHKRDAGC